MDVVVVMGASSVVAEVPAGCAGRPGHRSHRPAARAGRRPFETVVTAAAAAVLG